MAIRLKNARDIAGIWHSGQVTAKLHTELGARVAAGVATIELEDFACDYIAKHGGKPTFKGYQVGNRVFPAALCISFNEAIVHGIPDGRVIKPGDLVSIDLGVTHNGYISDAARTWYVGNDGCVCEPPQGSDTFRLCTGTKESLSAGIASIATGKRLRDVSRAIAAVLIEHKLGIIRDLSGHGVGFQLHEEPTLYNFDTGQSGPVLKNGLVIAIEPMATLGSIEILLGADEWTYSTADGSLAAHYENTVALWDNRVFVLTDETDDASRQAFGGVL